MERQVLIITIVLFLFFVVAIAVNAWINYELDDDATRMYRCPSYTGGEIMDQLYQKMGIRLTNDPHTAAIYLPCGYTWVENELQGYSPSKGQIIMALDGCDKIVSKNGLWKVLSEEYGREYASQLVPKSYVTGTKDDMQYLQQEYNPNRIYIMKKNVQRQQGLKITRDLSEMLSGAKSGYAVVQEYLMNPLLFDRRKFDIRVFLLVIQKNGIQYYYRHTGGRCHYTSQDFNTDSLAKEIHIPSGYSEDAEFKAAHPETLRELQDYLNKDNRMGDHFFSQLDHTLAECCRAFSKVIGTSKKFSDQDTIRCQLFGLDFLSDKDLRPVLIEINKGPELAWSSEPEYQYKKKMLIDMFELLGYLKGDTPNEFIPLLIINVKSKE